MPGEGDQAGGQVNCLGAIRHYLDRIIRPKDKDKEIKGMKALIMDRETVRGGALWRGVVHCSEMPHTAPPCRLHACTEGHREHGVHDARDIGQGQ